MLNPQGYVDIEFSVHLRAFELSCRFNAVFSDDDNKLICVETSCRLKTCPLADAMNNKKHRKYKDKDIPKYVLIWCPLILIWYPVILIWSPFILTWTPFILIWG